MAEAHPVAFRWVMKAKERGARIIHVDPRFSRTSAMAHRHVGLRAGSDIAFLGGLIRHVIETDSFFRDYVVSYTNAATIINEDFQDTEDLAGVFSGFDPETGTYDRRSWMYEGGEMPSAAGVREHSSQAFDEQTGAGMMTGEVESDVTLQHPRCVFQIVKRHFSRYTPEMVEEICGITREDFDYVANALIENSGRERTATFCYAVGWTQHTVGVQMIRAAAVLQLLLGNMGRPGGGILALRGHASIQGSTDIPTLYNLLPGYLPMPHALSHDTLQEYLHLNTPRGGFYGSMPAYLVSLLKAYWGEHALPSNDFCFDYLPRLTGDHSSYPTVMAQVDGTCKGYFLLGENPAVGHANSKMQRLGLSNLDWLVVRDFSLIESATWWKDGPEIETGQLRAEDIGTEVFFLPASTHV